VKYESNNSVLSCCIGFVSSLLYLNQLLLFPWYRRMYCNKHPSSFT